MKPQTLYLFVYGSLRSGFHHPAYKYISTYFELSGAAKAKGLLYDMGEYPAALPTNENHYLTGELYRIKNEEEFNWAFGQLDDYEGLHIEETETPLYRRSIVDVYFNNEIVPAWIYWYNQSIIGKPLVASGDVLQYLQQKNQ
jgi:Uncharacterized conserved protein